MKLFDVVQLKVAREGFPVGTVGTIVQLHAPQTPPVYEVEFANARGETLAVVAVEEPSLELAVAHTPTT